MSAKKPPAVGRSIADLYGRLWEHIATIRAPEIVEQFLSNVALDQGWFKDKVCLDAGCGPGFAASVLQRLQATCYACDLSPEGLDGVRRRLGENRDGVTLVSGSVLALPFASDSFDFVHCNGVLHHTTDPRRGFRELLRVTRPGGVVFVGIYGKGGLYNLALRLGRTIAKAIPYRWTDAWVTPWVDGRRVPNSFMPAKVSILDNLYVPIRHSYREGEIRRWFADARVDPGQIVRTRTTIFDHERWIHRVVFGHGYLQLRARKPSSPGDPIESLGGSAAPL